MTALETHPESDGAAPDAPGASKGHPQRAPRLRRLVAGLAIAYPLALLGSIAALRLVGERWWLTTMALYVPRILFALPLPFLIAALAVMRAGRLLAPQLVALALVLFPLMGLEPGGPRPPTPGSLRFRVFTANIGLGLDGLAPVLDQIRAADPDVVALEEVAPINVAALRAALSDYSFHSADQFVLASRFPVEEATTPPELNVDGLWDSAHYARFRVRTPGGPVRIYAAHPISPHDAVDIFRGSNLLHEITSGRILGAYGRAATRANTDARLAQIAALAEDAAASPEPVIIAGDTNLPGLSWAFARWLGRYQDAFAEAGRGFGYTYPAHRSPWMRIDRVLADARFRVLRAEVGAALLHTHHGLVADVELLPSRR